MCNGRKIPEKSPRYNHRSRNEIVRKNPTSKITQNSYVRLLFIRREHTHLVEFVPEATRTKYTEVVTMSERGGAKLIPAFERAIADAKKAVEDAAAARAAQAAAQARLGQGRGHGRRNRPQGGGST